MIGLGESLKKEYEGKTIIIDGFEEKYILSRIIRRFQDEAEAG